jgi:hypothetical protein
MRSSNSRLIFRVVLLAALLGSFAAPGMAMTSGPGGGGSSGGGGAPGGGGSSGASGGGNGGHAFMTSRATPCSTGSSGLFGGAAPGAFMARNGLAPNGQPCSGSGY